MLKGTRSILAGLILAMLMLMPLGVTALLRDSGHVSAEAVIDAKAALEKYIGEHPDASARSLAVVDYTRPSFLKRMVIIDLQTGRSTAYRVAHGKNSGETYARTFSNVPESNMSSLGLFRVTSAYRGDHGLALRLDGLDSLQNGNAAMRNIVLHSADYVSVPCILLNLLTCNGPRIGRSNGCFVVSHDDIGDVTSELGNGGFIYSWGGRKQTNR
jgi:hypothetical protein